MRIRSRRFLTVCGMLLAAVAATAQQDSIRARVILIGDAGEIDPQQSQVTGLAASLVLPGRSTVLFLGDNVYPRGMALPGKPDAAETRDILRAQYTPLRKKGAAVYFVPGNHDWDKMGKQGLAKIKAQWQFLEDQQDSLLHLVPANGCPGPYAINVSPMLAIIVFDSEWWLFPHNKKNPGADCECNTKDEIISKLGDLFYQNRNRMILLADHHPFESYGHHGGYYRLKDHIFPLTAVNKNLYIPLPVLGSLYPALRRLLVNPEDLRHPLYREMIRRIDGVFDSFPDIVHVSGHEHGMQFIRDKGLLQVVSGAGAKHEFVKKGKHALFARMTAGFVTADLMTDSSLRFTYFTREGTDTGLRGRFAYTLPFTPVLADRRARMAAFTADSITVAAHPAYDGVGGLHRIFFGENYRREWATPEKLPVIRISTIGGGLTPTGRGGGHQSLSLRLRDTSGREWVIRSVNKFPVDVIPEALRQTFAADVVNDAMSAQHPYSAMVVPRLAAATGVPHATPVIGWVAPDDRLGPYERVFAGTVNLLEERDPIGKTDNDEKMFRRLQEDNDNDFDSTIFLKAKLLDVLINDWDRHLDQWRFRAEKNAFGGKRYIPVPRDRDQALYTNQGVAPWIATRPWLLWWMQDVGHIRDINDLMHESGPLNDRFLNQFSPAAWKKTVDDFVAAVPDSVLAASLRTLPSGSRRFREGKLLQELRARRDALPAAMEKYYRFLNRTVDLRASDKNESIEMLDTAGGLLVRIRKLSKKNQEEQVLFEKVFDPAVTREIRLYTGGGDDRLLLNSTQRRIRIRIVGGAGSKTVDVARLAGKAHIYTHAAGLSETGSDRSRLKKTFGDDSATTAFVPTNPYDKVAPLATGGFNIDDGLILGVGIKFINQGFRRTPWANTQEVTIAHSFSTDAFRVRYRGEWKAAVGEADFLFSADARAPDNTQNYFGRGNQTAFEKTSNYQRYYRARFDLYTISPMLRWGGRTRLSAGPSFSFYSFDAADNQGRFILQTKQLHGYDSAIIARDKAHAGLIVHFTADRRDNALLTTFGTLVDVQLQGMAGLNGYSGNFGQLTAGAAVYRPLNDKHTLVLAERLGGGLTAGKTAFYQSLFLDGKDNLMGYRQFRFAGQHMLYNNLELRVKLTDLAGYFLSGQFGLTGFFDIGRVWEQQETSRQWHNGWGGGLYFAPASMVVVRATVGYSGEGLYPYVAFGFRF